MLRLDAEGCSVIASTYVGGSRDEQELSVAADEQGNAFFAGTYGRGNTQVLK